MLRSTQNLIMFSQNTKYIISYLAVTHFPVRVCMLLQFINEVYNNVYIYASQSTNNRRVQFNDAVDLQRVYSIKNVNDK